MDVAEQVAVIHEGKIEQIGSPRELYEEPASEFVMEFIGPVTRIGDAIVRPHDLSIVTQPTDGAKEALVQRIAHLSFEVRVELSLDDGTQVWVQLTRAQAEELELGEGQIVWVRPTGARQLAAVEAA